MIVMTEEEVLRLLFLLDEDMEAYKTRPHDSQYAHAGLARMWVYAAIRSGFYRISPEVAVVLAASLDVLIPGLDGEIAQLAKKFSASVRLALRELEVEMLRVDTLKQSRH